MRYLRPYYIHAILFIRNYLFRSFYLILNTSCFRYLKYEGYATSTLFFLVEASYVVSFVIVRGVLGSYIAYKIIRSDMFDLDEKIISTVFFFVSLALVYQVLGYVFHRYRLSIQLVSIYLLSHHHV